MKHLLPIALVTFLIGCNSSSNDNASQQLPPSHLPDVTAPERPNPGAGEPGHLPGDLIPDRLPIDWYIEASARYGMAVEDLDAVCRYTGEHPQMAIHVSCVWENEELTIVHFVSRHTSELEMLYEHAFIWVINDKQIDNGYIWPMVNHNAVGLADKHLSTQGDSVSFNIATHCANDECINIKHTLTHQLDGHQILSNSIPYDLVTDFDMDTYKDSERFYFRADFTDLNTGAKHNNTLHLLDDFPALMYKVLAPAFGY
ncbi:hypothetical protein BCT04_16310 [Vibrio breoganii]|uniref:hypothetical protein n=1 Tax=Vibrio breoganii TaxID=553239 RepID=UPI000C842598|nr:hypothetical protein [Vibrio breoganii]PMO62849.1 hypothetical protein BCT04_16310 [Vibrio breoganii]